MTRHSRYWAAHTTKELAAMDADRVIAVLPGAAIEQHGPHLPLSVDADIGAAVVERLAERLAVALPVLFLPPLPVGVSPEHADFAGTLSLSAETMLRVLAEIGASVAATGVRKLVLLNTHGGNPQVLDLAAQALRRERKMLVFPLNAYRYWRAEDLFDVHETAHGIHGGAVETSIMQAIAPDEVRADEVRKFPSRSEEMAGDYAHLRPFGRIASFGWQTQDLNPDGAVGDATLADADKGGRLLDTAVATLVEILGEIDDLSPDVLVDRER